MNLSKQIKKYRNLLGLSQEELAEKIYVSRQTISNWENERSYPDVHNLLLLSVLFSVSLDELVKGDVEKMKDKISRSEIDKYTKLMLVFLTLSALSIGPSLMLPDNLFFLPFLLFWSIGMYAAFQIERIKKKEDIRTYKEIIAFMEDKNLEKVRRERHKLKDLLSKSLIVILFTVIAGFIALLSIGIINILKLF